VGVLPGGGSGWASRYARASDSGPAIL